MSFFFFIGVLFCPRKHLCIYAAKDVDIHSTAVEAKRLENQKMTAKEFVKNYNMHDSLIESIEAGTDSATIIMVINFAFWMQKAYQEGEPETGLLQVTFHHVTEFVCPEDIPLAETSILNTSIENDSISFAVMNDMTDDCYDVYIKAADIEVRSLSD